MEIFTPHPHSPHFLTFPSLFPPAPLLWSKWHSSAANFANATFQPAHFTFSAPPPLTAYAYAFAFALRVLPLPLPALKPHTHTWQATNWNNNSINTLRKITQHISKRFRPLRALQLKDSRDLWHIVYRTRLLTCITYVSANLIHLHTHRDTLMWLHNWCANIWHASYCQEEIVATNNTLIWLQGKRRKEERGVKNNIEKLYGTLIEIKGIANYER